MNQNNSRDDFVNSKSYAFYHPKKSKLLKTIPHAPGESYNDEGETQESLQRTYNDTTQVLGEKETFSRTNKQSNNPTTGTTNQPPININFQFPQLSVFPSKTQSNLPTCSSKLPVIPRCDRQSIASNVVQTIKREVEGETPVLRAAPQISLQASKVQISLKEPETKPFKCEVCQHWFYTREKLIIHFITNHGKHHCSYCTEMFNSDLDRENHEKLTHIPLECDVCKVGVMNLNNHYEDIHDIKNCRFCGVLVKPKSYYKVHVQKKHFVNNVETLEEKNVRLVDNWTDSVDTWNFNCHLCGKERKRADIFGHFFSYHRLSLMCLIVFLRTEELVFSVQGTLTPSGAQADSFDQSVVDDSSKTSQTSGISSSIITYADLQNRSDCTVCTKPFTFQVPKPAHDIFCWGLTICRYCSKTFTDKVTRNVHMENEHLSFPCCRGCDKTITFSQETELLAHYKEVHAEIMCHYCEAFLPNNQLKLADHLKQKHGASNRSKMLEEKDVELVQINTKSRIYTCSLCNTNITSSMDDVDELFKHLQYHKISLLSTLLLLEKLQTTAKTGTKSKSQVKTKKTKKLKGEENATVQFENSVDDSLPLNLDTKVEFSRTPASAKKTGLAAKAKKLNDIQGKELSMLTSPEKNGCKRRESVIKRGSAKVKKTQDTDANKDQSGPTTGQYKEDFRSEAGEMKSVPDGMDSTAPHDVSLDSSSDTTSEEEDFGSEEAIENSTEEDDDLKDVLGNVDCLLPLEIEIGEAEIDPTEIECVISDTSDDEEYEDSSELDSSFEVKHDHGDVQGSLLTGQDNDVMQCEPFRETSMAYGSQQHRDTVLKHSFYRNPEDSVEKRMEDLFHEANNLQAELGEINRITEGKYVDNNGSKERGGGQGTSSKNHVDLNTINNHRPNDSKNSTFVDNVAHGDRADPGSALNRNCTQEAISDCQVFKATLNNIKTDPDDISCIEGGVHQVFSAKHPVLKCELCIEEKSNFATPTEYVEHLKSFHKFTISAHCSTRRDGADGLPNKTGPARSTSERGEANEEVHQCPFCAIRSSWKTTIRQHLFTQHYKDCVGEMPTEKLAYECRYCTQRFWRVVDRNEHQIVKHEDQFYEFYKCYVCSQISSSKLMLTRHLKVSHPAEPQFGAVSYKCKLCLLTYPSLGLLREHFTATHPTAMVFPCRQCNITLKNKKTLKTHIKNIHMDGTTNRRRDCTLCGKTLYSKRAYAIHYRMKHSVSSKVGFRCRICQKRFDTKDERKMHYAVGHLGESPYHCGECGKGFASKSGMYGHKQLHTGTGVSKCEYCGKEFTRKDSYNEHLLIHNGPRHKCPHCPKDFVQRSNLVRHIRIHTGEKPYKCLYCDKCFSDKGACNSHIRVHTREETCSCPYCGQTFSKKQKLKYHIRKHTGEGLIHCEICAKSFTNSFALKEHRLIHNRETQILCGTCGKGFNSEKYLQRHVAIVHEPLQMFACPLCEKSFTQQTRLKAHLMTHTGVKHMKCLLCDKAYSVRKSLRRHLLDKHQIAPEHPQYKRCFYALSPAEAGLQIPNDLSCFVAYDDNDDNTTREEVVKNTAKRFPRKPNKSKLLCTEPALKESTDKKVKRKIATKKAAVGKALGLSLSVETTTQEKPSTSRVVKKRQKSLPKKLIIPSPKETSEDSSCSCGESRSHSNSSAEMAATVEAVEVKEAAVSQLPKSVGTGKKKQRVEAIVEILQKTSNSPSSGSTNPEEEEESNRDESSDNEPVLARILPLNTPRVTGVGRRKLGQKSVPEKLSRKEKRTLSFKSSDDFS